MELFFMEHSYYTEGASEFGRGVLTTLWDVGPIVLLILFFQFVVLRRPLPNYKRLLLGGTYVILGLTLFLIGLEKALFPIGENMARQLTDPEFLGISGEEVSNWTNYYWVYLFAGFTGFATAIAEPSLIAVAIKASEVSGGLITRWGLRLAVASGVALALVLGSFRIIMGIPSYVFILAGYVIVILQTIIAPKDLVALAYDSGGVATSTVTVPIVVALGLGLSYAIPGRNPALDGFGMIAMACMMPIITVLAYIQWLKIIRKPSKT